MNPTTSRFDELALPDCRALTAAEVEVALNPHPRLCVGILADTSQSISPWINELNAALRQWYEAMRADMHCRQCADVCLITFGGRAQMLSPYTSMMDVDVETIPSLTAQGDTPLGAAIHLALDAVRERHRQLADSGLPLFTPWLIVLTDGQPNGELESAVKRLKAAGDAKRILLFPIAIGPDADFQFLEQIAQPGRPPKQLKDIAHLSELFEWIRASVRTLFGSSTTDRAKLPPTSDWAL